MHKDRHGGENVFSTVEGCIQGGSPIQQLLTLLGLVSVCPVEQAGGGDEELRPLMGLRGSRGAGLAGGSGIG